MIALQVISLTLITLSVPFVGILLFAAAFASLTKLLFGESLPKVFLYYVSFSIPIGLTAYVVGDTTGLSRAPAVANVVPAVLALIGGLNIYAFGTDNKYKVVIGYCVTIFAVMFFVGLQIGSHERVLQQEAYLAHLSQAEFRIRNLRHNLDLPDAIPSWVGAD